jgi:uncharacterized membrane protein YedE/YeeE
MQRFIEFLVGLLFGLGLLISGMTDPSKVQDFLDLSGNWDPSLAFVMCGAICVGLFGFSLAKKKPYSFSGQTFHWPELSKVDRPLILGSLLFGAGWGLAGFCPGPALVSMAAGNTKALTFVFAMLIGMVLFERLDKRYKRQLIHQGEDL